MLIGVFPLQGAPANDDDGQEYNQRDGSRKVGMDGEQVSHLILQTRTPAPHVLTLNFLLSSFPRCHASPAIVVRLEYVKND